MGIFISFEGGDGTGKSTQVELLSARLVAMGHHVVCVQEPGGTDLGDNLREYLKATDRPLTPEAELFLFVAARSELVRRVIRPALNEGSIVIADRYADSTTAYQGFGRRVSMKQVNNANQLATDGCWPDLSILLDVPPELGLDRTRITPLSGAHEGREEDPDNRRFEEAGVQFHKRVYDGYRRIVASDPTRWLIIDARASVEKVSSIIWARVEPALRVDSKPVDHSRRLPGL